MLLNRIKDMYNKSSFFDHVTHREGQTEAVENLIWQVKI